MRKSNDVIYDFRGKNFLVVGASSGMGRETAKELAEAGANVLAVARNKERLTSLRIEYSEKISTAVLDVTIADIRAIKDMIDEYVQEKGKLDGMVYAAGIVGAAPLRQFDEIQARAIMETGFWGAVKFLQVVTRKKYVNAASSFVIFSSVAGCVGEKGNAAYSATKAAVMVAAHSFAHDISRDGHRLNTICPGYVKTPLNGSDTDDFAPPEGVLANQMLGIGESSDVVGMVLFLLSNRAAWITGADFIVDGGYLVGCHR